ncbi:MAG: hypothetical protein QOG83_2272 [Alphaproteobacteria bacterium]|jgi:hypothetical protein|nr:hypothetical protein [Alphaproteobacteria bacterium]MEA2989561.1 hypothetical protein [Alphaproteobacteria bacterium]
MTTTLLAISAAYVVLALLLLSMGLTSRFAWWLKAGAIVVSSVFFVEVFYASKGLLGWPGTGPLPAKFQLLWSRVVEPDLKLGHHGAIYLWVEEVDENNVPSGLPRSYRLPYSLKLADRSLKARDEIMAGHPQEGMSEDMTDGDQVAMNTPRANPQMDGGTTSTGGKVDLDVALDGIPRVEFRAMSTPMLPPKP